MNKIIITYKQMIDYMTYSPTLDSLFYYWVVQVLNLEDIHLKMCVKELYLGLHLII